MASIDAQKNRKRKRNTASGDTGSYRRHPKKIKIEKTDFSQLKNNTEISAVSPRFGIPTRQNENSNGSNKPALEPSNTNTSSNKTKAKKRKGRVKAEDDTTADAQNDSTKQNRKKQGKKREAAQKTTLTVQSESKLLRSDGAVEVHSKGMNSRKGSVWDISSPSGGRFLDMDPLFSKDERYA